MQRKTQRPARCAPGSITNARELGERLRVSRDRLAASELAGIGRAWRLWGACVDATAGYAREADQTYATTLGKAAGIDRWAAGDLLRQFDALGVFVWKAAPRGSCAISELRLPSLDITRRPDLMTEHHEAPTPREGSASRGAHASLQGNTQHVETSESQSSRGNAIVVTPQIGESSTEAGTPSFDAMLKGSSVEELQRGVAEFAPTIAELYAAELERRNIAPRRRPAWLDN